MTPATKAQAKVAAELAAMATERHGNIRYVPTGKVRKWPNRIVWHSMEATSSEGSWEYWLAKDFGSYRGRFEA